MCDNGISFVAVIKTNEATRHVMMWSTYCMDGSSGDAYYGRCLY